MVRFVHTADWQLGMTRHFLDDGAQERFAQARFDAVVRIGEIAAAEGAELVVVGGDVFESNHVDRRTLSRALEALARIPVPVFLLPGNHDPLDAASVFRTAAFLDRKPANVHVLEGTSPVELRPGVEIVGAPWRTKRPGEDLVARALDRLGPAPAGTVRILVGHGAVDALSPDRDAATNISLDAVRAAIADGRVHYVALGDRHSLSILGDDRRVAYAGAPEATAFDEERPGHVLVVDAEPGRVETAEVPVGRWRFVRIETEFLGDADLDALERELDAIDAKENVVVRLALVGTLTLAQHARLERTLEHAGHLLAAVTVSPDRSDLRVRPDDSDFADLDLAGFARTALARLRSEAAGGGARAEEARDALALLVRLARPAERPNGGGA